MRLSLPFDSQRANDLRLAGFHVVLGDAEAIFFVHGKHELNELFIRNAGAEFPIDHVAGGFGKRLIVNGVDGSMERFDVEETILHMRGVVFQPLINAAACAGWFSKLTAAGDVFLLNSGHCRLNELVVIGQAREGGGVRLTSGGAKNFML